MHKVSVIIPIYNVEKYLGRALDSLLAQSYQDWEAILVDDGSTDGSATIARQYQDKDNRFILTSQQNQGQAVARNMGIEVADGDYITMLDADDRLSADALEKAVNILDQDPETGSVLLRLVYVNGSEQTPYPMRSDKISWSGEEAFRLSLDWSIHGLYVSRTDLFRRFPYNTSCRLYSDDNTTRMHYLHSAKVRQCEGVYYYRQHGESMTNRVSALRLELLEANMSMARQLREAGQGREVLALFERERWVNLTGIIGIWLRNREILDRKQALERFRRVWKDIDKSLLPAGLKIKLGYIPFHSFGLYFLQVQFYFLLRRLLGK